MRIATLCQSAPAHLHNLEILVVLLLEVIAHPFDSVAVGELLDTVHILEGFCEVAALGGVHAWQVSNVIVTGVRCAAIRRQQQCDSDGSGGGGKTGGVGKNSSEERTMGGVDESGCEGKWGVRANGVSG